MMKVITDDNSDGSRIMLDYNDDGLDDVLQFLFRACKSASSSVFIHHNHHSIIEPHAALFPITAGFHKIQRGRPSLWPFFYGLVFSTSVQAHPDTMYVNMTSIQADVLVSNKVNIPGGM